MTIIWKKKIEEEEAPERSTQELLNCSVTVINKPKGPFSFEITDEVKHALSAKKTGHAGTLDPNATGVLTIAVNKACNIIQAISHASKEYEGVMHLHTQVPLSKVLSTSKKFLGKITQLPPVRSAVKREERIREIYSLEVIDKKERDVKFKVKCEAGTYVRKLVTEWGEAMNSKAHLKDLIRTKAGPFTLKDTVNLDDFLNNPLRYLLPVEKAVSHLKKVWIDDRTIDSIKHGSQPFLPGLYKYDEGIKKGELIALMNRKQELVGIAFSLMNHEEYASTNGQFAKLERVMI